MTRRRTLVLPALLACSALLAFHAASGQEPEPTPGEAEEAEVAPAPEEEVPLDASTPRGAVVAYLSACRAGDFEAAAGFLDLSPVPQNEREREGPQLARRLKLVLDRQLWVDPESLSAEPHGHRDDGLPSRRDRVGSIETESGPVPIYVDRGYDAEGERGWRISALTVSQIPELYAEFGLGWLGELLPDPFFDSPVLDIQLWQWLALLVLLVAAYALSWVIVRGLIAGIARRLTSRTATDLDDRVIALTGGPLRLVVAVLGFTMGTLALGLAAPAQRFFASLEKAVLVVAVTWLLLRLVDLFGEVMERRLVREDKATAVSLVPIGRKTLKVAVVFIALLAALDSFGFDVTTVIAGLGVGGLAVALAAQKTLENLFGGATLLADRPVRVGDFCRFGDKVGTVEEIGMRSTRVRTLERTLVTVSNAEFSSLQLENFAARDRIRFNPRLGLRYETKPDQLRYVLVEIRRLLYAHPKVDPDPARIRFVGFGASSLDLDIHAYVRTSDYNEYLQVAEDLNLRIMDIVEEAGTGFAFPSSTTYLAKDDGLDPERSQAAEQAVERWRENGELFLPVFPEQEVRQLDGSLPWPPPGAPGARSDV